MRLVGIFFAAYLCFCIIPSGAEPTGSVDLAGPSCQADLAAPSEPSLQRLTLPLVDERKQTIALSAVIPDFDRERDVVVGIRDRKHTYLVNALIGRHDPGIFGGRGRFHDNPTGRHLTVSPGLIVRLRLSAPVVRRIAADMDRWRDLRNLTCTNTTARILARAEISGMTPFILTPAQLLRGFEGARDLEVRYYLVNASAESLEDFKDQVKVIGAKKATTPPVDPNRPRQNNSSCNDEDSSESCMFASFDLDGCIGSSQASECCTSESGACECSACEGSECGGSDSDCCH